MSGLRWERWLRQPLERKGAELRAANRRWNIRQVHGPVAENGREYFCFATDKRETLLVCRDAGEKGMRRLFLCAVLPANEHTPRVPKPLAPVAQLPIEPVPQNVLNVS